MSTIYLAFVENVFQDFEILCESKTILIETNIIKQKIDDCEIKVK